MRADEPVPECPRCGGIARPNILGFGDWSWISDRQYMQQERQEQWLAQVRQPVVSSSAPTPGLPRCAISRIASCVSTTAGWCRYPREPKVADARDIGLAMGALDALSKIDAVLEGMRT